MLLVCRTTNLTPQLSQRFPDGIICIPEYFPSAMLILVSNGGFGWCLLPTAFFRMLFGQLCDFGEMGVD